MKIKKHIENLHKLNNSCLRSDIECYHNSIVGKNLLFLGKKDDVWVIAIDKPDIFYLSL